MDLGEILSGDRVAEDNVVSYTVHDSTQGVRTLESLRSRCLACVAPFVAEYIWLRDGFSLSCSSQSDPPSAEFGDGSCEGYLWGCSRFGDTVDDEWLIVALLQHLTVAVSGIAARVWDNDGEFILIECALHIPRWLNPGNSCNRAWLMDGVLHLIPRDSGKKKITIRDALESLGKKGLATRAGNRVQEAIANRTKGYPEDASRNLHWAKCQLPEKVAQVLKSSPQLVSEAAHSFLHRDQEDMKAASRMAHICHHDQVTTMVYMHRCSYAQLMQQQFHAPKGYSMPSPAEAAFKAASLGLKLTAGFEILYTNAKQCARGCEDALRKTKLSGWSQFLASLESNGYFDGNIKGSRNYNELYSAASTYFLSSNPSESQNLSSIAAFMDDAWKESEIDAGISQVPLPAEDDDTWLFKGSEEIDVELENWDDPNHSQDRQEESYDPENLLDGLREFVDSISSYQGAEIPEDCHGDINFDSTKFESELRKALQLDDNDGQTPLDELTDNTGSSWMSDGDSSDGEVPERSCHRVVETATDSDDDCEDFQEAYNESMRHELRGSNVVEEAKEKCPGESSDPQDLEPVDLDMQVVSNLIESYTNQNGLPGPVGNLLGMMNLHVPGAKGKERPSEKNTDAST